jgi:DNA repair ATPase RecN
MIRKDRINAFIIQTIVMRLSEKESLAYLKDRGFDISVPYYYRLKKNIQQSRFDRLSLIAKTQFVEQHLERIDQLELINSEYWKLYRDTKDTFKKALILEKIAELQTYISPYYDASMYVMQKQVESNKQNETKKDNAVPEL